MKNKLLDNWVINALTIIGIITFDTTQSSMITTYVSQSAFISQKYNLLSKKEIYTHQLLSSCWHSRTRFSKFFGAFTLLSIPTTRLISSIVSSSASERSSWRIWSNSNWWPLMNSMISRTTLFFTYQTPKKSERWIRNLWDKGEERKCAYHKSN